MEIFACQPCIYVSIFLLLLLLLHVGFVVFLYIFSMRARYQSKAKCELCANLLHTQKYLLYCMAIKVLHD